MRLLHTLICPDTPVSRYFACCLERRRDSFRFCRGTRWSCCSVLKCSPASCCRDAYVTWFRAPMPGQWLQRLCCCSPAGVQRPRSHTALHLARDRGETPDRPSNAVVLHSTATCGRAVQDHCAPQIASSSGVMRLVLCCVSCEVWLRHVPCRSSMSDVCARDPPGLTIFHIPSTHNSRRSGGTRAAAF